MIAQRIADWLDRNLPKDVSFSTSLSGISRTIEHFTDHDLIYRIMRRHLMNLQILSPNYTTDRDENFFFWLYGLVTHVTPEDNDFLEKIRELITVANRKSIAEAN